MEDNSKEPSRQGKSGQQRGAENVERLRAYIDELRATGTLLPARNGRVDKSAVAVSCGFDRQTLYNNPEARACLEQAVEEIGIVENSPSVSGRAAHLEQVVGRRERRIQHLEERLQTCAAKKEGLLRENKELKERVRQYEIMEEIMTTTGRKYRP